MIGGNGKQLWIALAFVAAGSVFLSSAFVSVAEPSPGCDNPPVDEGTPSRNAPTRAVLVAELERAFGGAITSGDITGFCGGMEASASSALATVSAGLLPEDELREAGPLAALKWRGAQRRFSGELPDFPTTGALYATANTVTPPLTIHYFDLGTGTAWVWFEPRF